MINKAGNLYPPFQHVGKMQKMCQPFLKSNSLSFFQIRRSYNDGGVSLLSTNMNVTMECIRENYLRGSFFEKQNAKNYGDIYMFKDMAPPILVSFIEEKHKIFDVITLVRQGKGYTDFFSFGLPEKCSAAAGYYAMILRDLEAFVADFLNSARSIMNSTEKHFVPFVEHKSDDFFLPPYNPAGYVLKGRKGQVSITHEEFILLHLIHQGKTKSEISKILSFPAYQIDYLITLLTKKTGYPLYILKPSMVKSCYTADSGNDIPSFWKDAPGEREYRAALS